MKTVLIDTNIILWTFNGGPDFREAILEVVPGAEIEIPTCVIKELEKLDTKEAKASLSEAVSVSNLTIPDFINTQYYKSESDSNSLRMVLENIEA